ncbi:hypothetical protein [uncultured Shimia sp.]|uniref:hypothetical protein n=1 Tax=uncultured Shimia sp. TaxID=573152 RepID=UPI00263465E4|nr:hypothetical protein [uncultured Shimia sp.]
MTSLPIILVLLLGVGALMVFALAYAFYSDPEQGMAQATHRPEKLPLVMIDRYIAVGVIQIGLIFFGSLEMVAVFCVAGAIMGLGDGLIYAKAKLPHMKHTSSGLLAVLGLVVTLFYLNAGGAA